MSIVERDGIEYKKPENPMDPENSNWDKPIEKRLMELENRLLNVEINLLELLKAIIEKTEPKKIEELPDDGLNA